MRIERVELRAFGHFVDTTFELDHPSGGLRFIVGPNEAGKSTLRSALRTGLFGFEGRDVAGRPAASSAVTLHLTRNGSETLVVARINAGAPRDGSGRPLDPAILGRWVGVTREAFDALFCLGHDELRRHGQALLQSGEDLGRVVFGAALGGPRLEEVANDLAARLDDLFKPRGHTKKLNKAFEDLAQLDEKLRTMTVSANAWDRLKRDIDHLEKALERLRESDAELTKEVSRLERIQRTASLHARLLEYRDDLETLLTEGVTLDVGNAVSIESLREDRETATEAAATLQRAIDDLRDRLEKVGTDSSALDHSADITDLHQQVAGYRQAVERVRLHALSTATTQELPEAEGLIAAVQDQAGLRSAVQTLAELDADVAGDRAAIEAKKAALGLEGVDDASVSTLPVPSEDVIESAREEGAERAAQRRGLAKDLADLERDVEVAEERLRELEEGRAPLPTDAEVDAVRGSRDRSWTVLKGWFVDGAPPPTADPDRAGLADEVETGISRADAIVDRVRVDTDRAAKTQGERRQLLRLVERRRQLETSIEKATIHEREAQDAWRTRWRGVTERIGGPKEMSEWRHAWRELCQGWTDLSATLARAERWRATIAAATERLDGALRASGHAPPSGTGLLAMLEKAEELTRAEKLRLDDAREAAIDRAQIEATDAKLSGLLPLLPPETNTRADLAIEALHTLCSDQARDRARRAELEEQVDQQTVEWETTRAERDRLDARLREEATALAVDVDQLPVVTARAKRAAQLRQKIDEREQQLLDVGDGLNLPALQAEAAAAGQPDEIAARLDAIEREREELDADRAKVIEDRLTLRNEFRSSAGGDATASIGEEQAAAFTRIAALLDEITVLTLAASLLERVVDAARDTGRGPLLERASHYFALLTDDAFARIDVEAVGNEVYTVAVRADGSRLYPDALSDGTYDQMWLAWRLAGVEHHLEQMGPVPLIVDDVLVNFDDARASCAFAALASLAERTQVLVLTHHSHLVEIAQQRLGENRVWVTDIGARPVEAMAITQLISSGAARGRPPVPRPVAPPPPTHRAPMSGTESINTAAETLLAALDGKWRGKKELLERSKIAEAHWGAAIRALLAKGAVTQEGAKKGAKYRLVADARHG